MKVFGKWILAGEYAVLQGERAIAFPLLSHFIEMDIVKNTGSFSLTAKAILKQKNPTHKGQPSTDKQLKKNFEQVLDLALKKLSKTRADLKCHLDLKSTMAFGVGLGGSAVLAVLVGKLFHQLGWLKNSELFNFCHNLENHIHGQSSGLDISVVLTGQPILFMNKKNLTAPSVEVLTPQWKPFICLSYAGPSLSTKQNIKQVEQFWQRQAELAKSLNQQMNKATFKALKSLQCLTSDLGLPLMQGAFNLAEQCFKKWNLITPQMREHSLSLKKQGALATKPTGSGNGGYMLSLWAKEPPTGGAGRQNFLIT